MDQYCQPALVEDLIDGREFHVSVWGNETLTVLPPAEMDFSFFSNVKDRLCTMIPNSFPAPSIMKKLKPCCPPP